MQVEVVAPRDFADVEVRFGERLEGVILVGAEVEEESAILEDDSLVVVVILLPVGSGDGFQPPAAGRRRYGRR